MRNWLLPGSMKNLEIYAVIGVFVLGLLVATASQAGETANARVFSGRVAGGAYLVAAPKNIPENKALPILFYYHGYGQSARNIINDKNLRDLASRKGVLLVVPDGLDQSWSNVGAPSEKRDEIAFTQEILRDVRSSWRVDDKRIWASGFSQGGSMAWDVACYMGEEFTAFFPVAGSFWRPHPPSCQTAVNLRHIHGLADTVVPMKGRQIGSRWYQGDVREGIGIWQEANGCNDEVVEQMAEDLDCRIWSGCKSGKTLELCLHQGGHSFKTEWLAQGIEWAEKQTVQ
ncbi:alpha/beta hydrolase family esterase [Kiloniella laminariae]|uniref:alpha/beta hydrolase family esterase n=1 Tax=Kiloniella laminariae TaxID=454162 RepID=UPI00039D816C|nr:PHB depolymerase family esterase [Kiloniella laminariae]